MWGIAPAPTRLTPPGSLRPLHHQRRRPTCPSNVRSENSAPSRLRVVNARWREVAAISGPMLTPVSNKSAAALGDCSATASRPSFSELRVDRRRLVPRQVAHRPAIAMRPRDCLRDPSIGWSAPVGGVIHIAAFAVQQLVNQSIQHRGLPIRMWINLSGCLQDSVLFRSFALSQMTIARHGDRR